MPLKERGKGVAKKKTEGNKGIVVGLPENLCDTHPDVFHHEVSDLLKKHDKDGEKGFTAHAFGIHLRCLKMPMLQNCRDIELAGAKCMIKEQSRELDVRSEHACSGIRVWLRWDHLG